jgi:hypothetical protein
VLAFPARRTQKLAPPADDADWTARSDLYGMRWTGSASAASPIRASEQFPCLETSSLVNPGHSKLLRRRRATV